MKELAKTYDPSSVEDRLYQEWMEKKYFLQIRMKMAGCTVIQRLSVRKKKAESIRSGYRLLRGMSIRNLRF